VIAHLRGQPWWNGKLIIFGGSEGGAVAALLAPLLPETAAVVIRSSGIGVSIADLIRLAVPPPVAAEMPKIITAAKANPTGDIRWGGSSYRWWADAADVVPALALLQAKAPVLLIQGELDQHAPVATARATRDIFATAKRRNLTYREYAGLNHFMVDPQGTDHREAVLKDAASWLQRH
jgi:alpha-beta hydrolase superfamily lysophospholipase